MCVQDALTAAAAAAAALNPPAHQHNNQPHARHSPQHQQQQLVAEPQRMALLHDIFHNSIPTTLTRPGDGTAAAAAEHGESHKHRPPWHSIRGAAGVPGSQDNQTAATNSGSRVAQQRQHTSVSAVGGAVGGGGGGSGKNGGGGGRRSPGSGHADAGDAEAAWEAQLPAGLNADKCVGLPQTVSVRQLVEVRLSAAAAIAVCGGGCWY